MLLNFSEEQAVFEFDLPEEFGTLAQSNLYDLLSEENVPAMVGERMRISVPALTTRVLAEEPVQQ